MLSVTDCTTFRNQVSLVNLQTILQFALICPLSHIVNQFTPIYIERV